MFRVCENMHLLEGVLAATPWLSPSRAFTSCKNLYIYASEPKNKAEPSPAEHRNPETYHSSHKKPHPSQFIPNGDTSTHVRHSQRQCLLTLSRSVHAYTHLSHSHRTSGLEGALGSPKLTTVLRMGKLRSRQERQIWGWNPGLGSF